MRAPTLLLCLLAGCGAVRLGSEPNPDAGSGQGALDASRDALRLVVTVTVDDEACAACAELAVAVTAGLGTPPFTFEWDDGSNAPRRTVCAPVQQDAFTVSVSDAEGRRSAPQVVRLDLPLEGCLPDAGAPLLCLENRSFEGVPAVNSNAVPLFDAEPWTSCTNPLRLNTPDIVNDSIPQWVIEVPKPTDGETFLSLSEGEQASQALCAPLRGGDLRSFRIDAQKLDISNVTWSNTEKVFLQVWGGISANCTLRELLYVSPALGESWQDLCITLAPQQYTDQLTLAAISDESQPSLVYLIADRLEPVERCP